MWILPSETTLAAYDMRTDSSSHFPKLISSCVNFSRIARPQGVRHGAVLWLCTHTLHVTGKHHRCRHTQHMFILPMPGSIAFALRVFQSSKAGTSRALNTTYLQTLSLASAFEPKMQVTKRISAKFELCTGVPFSSHQKLQN